MMFLRILREETFFAKVKAIRYNNERSIHQLELIRSIVLCR